MAITINGTGGIADVNGTAANPAITGADADTGVYFGTNLLGLSTNGTSALYVDSSQNVGIGTTSPVEKLTVTGSISSSSDFVTKEGTTARGYVFGNSTGLNLRAASGLSHIFDQAGTERMRIDSSGYITNGANGNSAGLVQGSQYYRLNSGLTGSNTTSAQQIFGVGVTLAGSTVYEFEIVFAMIKTAGTTSHVVNLSFGGGASLNNIGYNFIGVANITGTPGIGNAVTGFSATSGATQISGSSATAGMTNTYFIKGTVSVNAGGTFIPQYATSAAPGGAYTVQTGAYVKISPLGASGANINIGSWA